MNDEYYAIKITPMARFNINQFPNRYFKEVICLNKFNGKSNFIQKLISSFHDYDNLYFVSKYYDGIISNYLNYTWDENTIKFFAGCLIQCLDELRKENIIHKDLYFQNLVLDEKGYINLIDFHISMEYKNRSQNIENHHSFGFIKVCPPEMKEGFVYDFNSDYYRLGSLLYFIIFRKYPNDIKDKKNITDIKINLKETKNFSFACIDFINKLIISDFRQRIGYQNINELKKHDFFINFSWNDLIDGKMNSPFGKIKRDNRDLCKKKYIFKKKLFLKTKLLKNNTFKNLIFSYDNINNYVVSDIFNSINNISIKSEKIY